MKFVRYLAFASFLLVAIAALARNADRGYVAVDANPATVSVYVDDEYVGPASANGRPRKYEIPVGRHVIKLTEEGYQESTQHVYVTPGHITTLAIALSRN